MSHRVKEYLYKPVSVICSWHMGNSKYRTFSLSKLFNLPHYRILVLYITSWLTYLFSVKGKYFESQDEVRRLGGEPLRPSRWAMCDLISPWIFLPSVILTSMLYLTSVVICIYSVMLVIIGLGVFYRKHALCSTLSKWGKDICITRTLQWTQWHSCWCWNGGIKFIIWRRREFVQFAGHTLKGLLGISGGIGLYKFAKNGNY